MQEIKLTEIQKDAMQEVANIGAGHASTVLSQMVNDEITMGIPDVRVVPLQKVRDFVEAEKVVVGVFLKISDEIPSYVLLLIPRDSAFSLANMLLGKDSESMKSEEVLSELDISALKEVSNVMICAFFDSLSEFLGMTVVPGPPQLAYDEPDAVLDYVLIQIGEVANEVVVFNVDLKDVKRGQFKINMFLMPEPQSIDTILKKLGV